MTFQRKPNLSLKINTLSPSINFSTDSKEFQTWENIPPPISVYCLVQSRKSMSISVSIPMEQDIISQTHYNSWDI